MPRGIKNPDLYPRPRGRIAGAAVAAGVPLAGVGAATIAVNRAKRNSSERPSGYRQQVSHGPGRSK